jgi:hypothetical protein
VAAVQVLYALWRREFHALDVDQGGVRKSVYPTPLFAYGARHRACYKYPLPHQDR